MIKAKKSLGQNFLNNKKIAQKIANIASCPHILEIGPGTGVLTEFLLKKSDNVVAIEKDIRLKEFLYEKFSNEIKVGKLELLFTDALHIDFYVLFDKEYCVVANIPYYITGAILRKLFSQKRLPNEIVLLVQKEVAERIISQRGSILSHSIKFYGVPRIAFNVPAKNFTPKPKVDSAILHISAISNANTQLIDEDKFFKVLKKAFSNKRKTLVNNLSSFKDKKELEKFLVSLGHKNTVRPEELNTQEFIELTKFVYAI